MNGPVETFFQQPKPVFLRYAEAFSYLRSIGCDVEPAQGVPGLTDISGPISARDVTIGQVIAIADQDRSKRA